MTHAQDPSYVLALAGTFLVICPTLVGLRLYTRHTQKYGLGLDDYLVIPATLLTIGCAIVLIVGVRQGVLGYPTPQPADPATFYTTPSFNFTAVQKVQWAFFLMSIAAIGLIKLSFLFLFRKIFAAGRGRVFNAFTLAFAVILLLWTLAFFFWELFSCGVPLDNRWKLPDSYLANCATDDMQNYALAISDFITDCILLFIPIPLVIQLQLPLRRKLLVLVAFSFGAVAIAASAIRLALFIFLVRVDSGATSDPGLDPNLLTTQGLYWSMLELGLALIANSLPALNHFLRVAGVRSMVRSARNVYPLRSFPRSPAAASKVSPGVTKASHGSKGMYSEDSTTDLTSTTHSASAEYNKGASNEIPRSGVTVTYTMEQTSHPV